MARPDYDRNGVRTTTMTLAESKGPHSAEVRVAYQEAMARKMKPQIDADGWTYFQLAPGRWLYIGTAGAFMSPRREACSPQLGEA